MQSREPIWLSLATAPWWTSGELRLRSRPQTVFTTVPPRPPSTAGGEHRRYPPRWLHPPPRPSASSPPSQAIGAPRPLHSPTLLAGVPRLLPAPTPPRLLLPNKSSTVTITSSRLSLTPRRRPLQTPPRLTPSLRPTGALLPALLLPPLHLRNGYASC